jgi:hypothetical protein
MVFFSFLDTTAQIPMAIPYQAVARDASGNLLVNQAVGIRFSILSDSPSLSTVHYQETHSATTTDLGQINLNIGSGTVSSGTFSAIPWANSNMRLQVEMDPSGGTNYTVTGVTVFGAVPYAFRSGSSELSGNGVPNGTAAGQTLRWNGTAWEASSLLLNNGNNISINPGAAAPDLMLTIGDNVSKDGGIVAMGQAGLGPTLTTTGSGSRMIWYPKKSAFRVGYANGNSWDDSQIGGYSFASGFGSIVTGEFSFSAGSSNTVSGWYSAAFGSSNQVGTSGPTSGWSSAAFGSGNQVAGNYSFAVGQQNVVSTSWATAFGSNNAASAYYSLAGGQYNTASGEAAVALGRSNQASGLYSFAAGNESAARGNRSMAFGQGAIARSWSEIALGSFNTDYTPADSNSFNSNDRIFVIGNGNYSARKNALVILKNGNLGLGENNPNELFVVGSGGKFRVDTLGNIKRINNISYSWPASQGSANQFLKNDGSGNLSWAIPTFSASDINTGTLSDSRLSANISKYNQPGQFNKSQVFTADSTSTLGSVFWQYENVPLIVRGINPTIFLGSTYPLTVWQSWNGTDVAAVSSNGVFFGDGSGLTNIQASSNTAIAGDVSGTLGSSQISNSAVGSVEVADLSIQGIDLASGSVTSSKISDGTISTVDMADGSVTSIKVLDGTLATADLADGSVISTKVLDGTLATADFADGSVISTKVLDGTLATVDLADGCVTSLKIADGTISTADLADGSVNSAKVSDGTIATADLANASVTDTKLADNSVSGAKLAMGSDALGDLMYYNGTDYVRLAAGSDGQILKMSGGVPSWSAPTGTIANTFNAQGSAITPTSTLAFLSPTVTATVSTGQKVLLNVNCALGAVATAASSLNIYPGYKLSSGTVTASGAGIWGLSCPINTRQVVSINGLITGLAAGTYNFGMVGTSTSAYWTNNEYCYVTAVVIN